MCSLPNVWGWNSGYSTTEDGGQHLSTIFISAAECYGETPFTSLTLHPSCPLPLITPPFAPRPRPSDATAPFLCFWGVFKLTFFCFFKEAYSFFALCSGFINTNISFCFLFIVLNFFLHIMNARFYQILLRWLLNVCKRGSSPIFLALQSCKYLFIQKRELDVIYLYFTIKRPASSICMFPFEAVGDSVFHQPLMSLYRTQK